MGPPCIPACFSLCGHQRELGAHRGPMLSNRDCAKRQAEMGMGAPATISHGRRRSKLRDRHQPSDFRTRSDKRDGDSSPMASSKAPELRDRGEGGRAGCGQGRRGSGDLSRAAPIPGCAQISGRPARNRAVFINGRRLERVICSSGKTATGSAKHKARSAKPDCALLSLPSRTHRPS